MIYIAHRGLMNGPNKELENKPEQIMFALDQGFHCEIDLWVHEADFYLGHDEPQYLIEGSFLFGTPNLWIHAKNFEALDYLTNTTLLYFWHQNDDYTLTSNNIMWTYPGKPVDKRSIMVMPETVDPSLRTAINSQCYGICSDYIDNIRKGITL